MTKDRSNLGLTLIELVIAIGLFSLLSITLTAIFNQAWRSYYYQQAKTHLQGKAEQAINKIVDTSRETLTVVSTYTASDENTYTTSDQELVLELAAIDENNQIIADQYDYFIFLRDPTNNKNLLLLVYPDEASARPEEDKVLTDRLASLAFSFQNDQGETIVSNFEETVMIEINLSLEGEPKYGQTAQVQTTSKARLRNK